MTTISSASPSVSSEKTDVADTTDGQHPIFPTDLERLASSKPNNAPPETTYQVSFTGDSDALSPRSMPTARKWLITLIVSFTSFCVAFTSSIYTTTYDQIREEFHISEIVATLGLSLFVVGLALSPMVLAPLSEFYGRKPVYMISLLVYVIWIIPCARAQNIQTMLIARFFNGFFGAAFLSVAGGTIGDMFSRTELHLPMMIYTGSPFMGPEFGPVVGGFINYFANWRWTFYVLIIWASIQWILIAVFVPETYHPVLLRNEARRRRKETGEQKWYAPIEKMDRTIPQTILRSCYRPFVLLILEPMCFLLCIYTALLLGVVYLFFGAFELVFSNNHGFNLWQIGLTFLGMAVGMMIAISFDPFFHKTFLHLVRKREEATGEIGGTEPEFRLPPAIVGAPLVTIGLLWFGWTTYASVHWIVPIIGSSLFGAGVLLVYAGVFTFLVDSYPTYAASALAANSFTRSMFAAGFPLFGTAMYNKLGYQWATFVLAMLTLLMAPFPYVFFKYGKEIRKRSRYAGTK